MAQGPGGNGGILRAPVQHTVVALTSYGPSTYAVKNPETGEIIERCASFSDALAAQKKYNALAAARGY